MQPQRQENKENMIEVVELFDAMMRKGTIQDYALCVGIAVKYYANSPATKDHDFFVIVNDDGIGFMAPVYAFMQESGATFYGQFIVYKGTVIDAIPVYDDLAKVSGVASLILTMMTRLKK